MAAKLSPEQQYQQYRKDKSALSFMKFPLETINNEYNITLVARDYGIAAGLITNTALTNGVAKFGYILPLPSVRLMDTYQVSFDEQSSFLGMIFDALPRGVQAGLQQVGLSVNKYKSVLLQAPQFKRHEFVWKLSPKNAQESRIINRIANTLKNCAAPSLNLAQTVFQYPYIFDIYFPKNYEYMYGFKPSVIESVSVDYSGGNQQPALYNNGAPESVVITLNMVEIEVWTKEDYDKWFNTDTNAVTSNPIDTLRQTAAERAFSPVVPPEARGREQADATVIPPGDPRNPF